MSRWLQGTAGQGTVCVRTQSELSCHAGRKLALIARLAGIMQSWFSKLLKGDDTFYFYTEHFNYLTNKMESQVTRLNCLEKAKGPINIGVVVGTVTAKTPFRAGEQASVAACIRLHALERQAKFN